MRGAPPRSGPPATRLPSFQPLYRPEVNAFGTNPIGCGVRSGHYALTSALSSPALGWATSWAGASLVLPRPQPIGPSPFRVHTPRTGPVSAGEVKPALAPPRTPAPEAQPLLPRRPLPDGGGWVRTPIWSSNPSLAGDQLISLRVLAGVSVAEQGEGCGFRSRSSCVTGRPADA